MTTALAPSDIVRGVAVVVDDRVKSPEGALLEILTQLKQAGMPLLLLETLPSQESLVHWKQVGLIVLDWELPYSGSEDVSFPAGITIPTGLADDSQGQVIAFVRELLTMTALPIFIASNSEPDAIRETLESELSDLAPRLNERVAVFSKAELEEGLFETINKRIEARPSLAVLRSWNRAYVDAEIETFDQFSTGAEDWVAAIHRAAVADGEAPSEALREILSRNIFSRIGPLDHKLDTLSTTELSDASALRRVMHLSAVIPDQSLVTGHLGTGDLFVADDAAEPYPLIRVLLTPDCDLPRKSKIRLTYVTATLDTKPQKSSKARATRVRNPDRGKIYSCVLTPSGDEYTIEVSGWESLWIYARGYESDEAGGAKLILEPQAQSAEHIGEGAANPGAEIFVEWPKHRRLGRLMEPYLSQLQHGLAVSTIRKGLPRIPDDFFN